MQLLWTDATPGETSFQVARSVTGSGAWSFFNLAANTTSYVSSGLIAGASYDHMVRACDANGCSGWSNTVTAEAGSMKLTVTSSAGGKVTGPGITCGQGATDCTQLYDPGTVVTLHATPLFNPNKNIEFELDHWEGACAGQGYSCTLTMNAAKTTRAVFVQSSSL
jgi:hypothetical protein